MNYTPHIRIENGTRIFAYPSDLVQRCADCEIDFIGDRIERGTWFNISLREWQRTEVVEPSELSEEDNDRAWLRVTGCLKRHQPELDENCSGGDRIHD